MAVSNNRPETIISLIDRTFNVILSRSLGSCHIFIVTVGNGGFG
jgi:hypothetical protein